MSTRRYWLALGAALAAAGCVGTESGNPPSPPKFGFRKLQVSLQSSDPGIVSVQSGDLVPQVSGARMFVQSLRLDDCNGNSEVLMSGEVTDLIQAPPSFEMSSADVCSLSLRVTPGEIDWQEQRTASPSELSFGFSGAVGETTSFFIESESTIELNFDLSGVELSEGTDLALSFDVVALVTVGGLGAPDNGMTQELVIAEDQPDDPQSPLQRTWVSGWTLYEVVEGQEPLAIAKATSEGSVNPADASEGTQTGTSEPATNDPNNGTEETTVEPSPDVAPR